MDQKSRNGKPNGEKSLIVTTQEADRLSYGFRLLAQVQKHMLEVYDQFLEDISDLYYSKERSERHALVMAEACDLAIDMVAERFLVHFEEINQALLAAVIDEYTERINNDE